MSLANCYYCNHGKIIEVNGVKKAVCSTESLNLIVKNPLNCTYSCINFDPTKEQLEYLEYQRTHSIHYEEPKVRKPRKRKNATLA